MATKSNGNNKPAPVLQWHSIYDAAITALKGAVGTVPTGDAYRLATTLGTGKRPGVEALYIAMCLRPEGCNPDDFVTVKAKHGYAHNCLQYLNDEGNRALYKVLHVTKVGKVRVARLTAKGEAQMKAAGMSATALRPFMGAVKLPVTVTAKPAPKPVTATPKAKAQRKPATAPAPVKPASEPAKPPAPAHPVLTQAGPKMPQPATTDNK